MHYGEDWYECQQESKYLGDEYVDEGRLRQEFPHIHAQVHALGLQYVFVNQSEFNLSLVREFYANWNTHRVELNQGLIRDSRVRFPVEALNEFLGTPNCDNSEFLAMIERPPYRNVRHTLCGVNSIARWDRVTLLPCKNRTDVPRERVVLVYRLMKGLLALLIEEEVHDVSHPPPPGAPHLVCHFVDVTSTKANDPSHEPRNVHVSDGPGFPRTIDDDDASADEGDGSTENELDDIVPIDDDTDTGDGDGNATSMAMDFATNVATC
ncbi:hypothetical protein KY289_001354 [Solanum tuberosum]|nr:hypothetical protein KY289_001354 [Solanum tuberosum]